MGLFGNWNNDDDDGRTWVQRHMGIESDAEYAERMKRRDPYKGKKWVCPRCGTTNVGGARCRECDNLNPYCQVTQNYKVDRHVMRMNNLDAVEQFVSNFGLAS